MSPSTLSDADVLRLQSVDAHEVDVTFCGTQDLGSVAKDSVYPYATKLGWCDTKQKERWKKKFRQAVDEAATLHEAQLQLGGGMPTTLLVGGSTSQAEAQDTHVLEAVAVRRRGGWDGREVRPTPAARVAAKSLR